MSSDEGQEEFEEVSEELRKREEVVGVACFSGRGFLLICACRVHFTIICESECKARNTAEHFWCKHNFHTLIYQSFSIEVCLHGNQNPYPVNFMARKYAAQRVFNKPSALHSEVSHMYVCICRRQ